MNFKSYILLEKDHRSKMVGFGIPQDVAEHLHSLNDKYSLWFAKQLKLMNGFQRATDKLNWIRANLQTDMQGILDWVATVPNIQIINYNWETAVAAHQEFHNSLESRTLEIAQTGTILKKYSNGLYWVDLETNNSDEESELMGHCGRTSADTIWSLRKYYPESNRIEAFITMGVNPMIHRSGRNSDNIGSWQQAKGKKNSKPKAEYEEYIADILVSNTILKFKSEYSRTEDFDSEDLLQYVQDNMDKFDNADELVERIEELRISIKDFDKLLTDYAAHEMGYYNISIDDGYSEEAREVYISASVFISIPMNKLALTRSMDFISDIDKYDSDINKSMVSILNKAIDGYIDELTINHNDDALVLSGDINSDDSRFSMDEEGLSSFQSSLENYKNGDDELKKNIDDLVLEINNLALLGGYNNDNPYGKFVSDIDNDIEDKELIHIIHFRKNNQDLNSIVVFEGMSLASFFTNPKFNKDYMINMFNQDANSDDIFNRYITPWLSGVKLHKKNKSATLERNLPLYHFFEFADQMTSHGQYGNMQANIINGRLYFYHEFDPNESTESYNRRLQHIKNFDDDYRSILSKFNTLLNDVVLPAAKQAIIYDHTLVTWKVDKEAEASPNRNTTFSILLFDKQTGKRVGASYNFSIFGEKEKFSIDNPTIEDLKYQQDHVDRVLDRSVIIVFPKLDITRTPRHPDQMQFKFESFYKNILGGFSLS